MLYKYRLTGTLAAAAMLVAISGCGGAKPAGTGSTGSTTPPLAAVAQPTTT
ncbi:MAG: hypothetical protein JWN15_3548, partial [Firmicutes bacterium]|nr:hypothetical protein [Bacillota bacterium]